MDGVCPTFVRYNSWFVHEANEKVQLFLEQRLPHRAFQPFDATREARRGADSQTPRRTREHPGKYSAMITHIIQKPQTHPHPRELPRSSVGVGGIKISGFPSV